MMVNFAPGVLVRCASYERPVVVGNVAEGSLPFHRIQLGRACPPRYTRTELHWGSTCSLLVAVVVAGGVPFDWHTGNPGLLRIIPDTALLSGEVLFLQDHAGPVSCV